MYNHGIIFTYDDPDKDYCSWKCRCGASSQVSEIEWSYMTAAAHIDLMKEQKAQPKE